MPRTKSAKKALRQARRHRERNKAQMTALRTAVKKARTASGEQTALAHVKADQALDRAARKGRVHKNRAARPKSRLAKSRRAMVGG